MAIQVADGFSLLSTNPLDARLKFTSISAMKAFSESSLYDGCFAYNTENKKYYTYDSSNTVDTTTGKWREFEAGGGTDDYTDLQNKPQINSITLSGNKSLSDLGIAPANVANDCYKTDDTAETGIDDADYFPFYDASATAKKKSLWSNIKSVLKTYFDTIYSTFSGSYNDLSDKPTIVSTRETPASGGTTLSLVNTGDMYSWNLSVPSVMSATLSSGSTSVTFTDVPTSGDKVISILTSKIGLDYDSVSQSGSTVTVTFPSQSSSVTVYLKIENA